MKEPEYICLVRNITKIFLGSLFAFTACTDNLNIGSQEQHGEVENFPCGGSGSFPCLNDTDATMFNNRFPFCLGVLGPQNPKTSTGLVPVENLTACQVGEEDSGVGCRHECGDLGPVFTSSCAYQYNAVTDEYVGRCLTSFGI